MRGWWFGRGVGDVDAGADMLVYRVEFARQQVDLPPLRGDGCIQFLDGLVLVGDAGFEGFEALGKVGNGDVLLRCFYRSCAARSAQRD